MSVFGSAADIRHLVYNLHTHCKTDRVFMGSADKLFTDGEAYERMMGRWSRLVGETFLDWLDVPKGLRWLDVGCGNGSFTEELIARCAPTAVMAIDPSEDQLAVYRRRLPEPQVKARPPRPHAGKQHWRRCLNQRA